MTYAQLFNHLRHINLIELRNWTVPDPLPASHDPNARCVFHSGGVGHDIENCWAFKHKVQDLIDNETIEFKPSNGPNVVQNPMPPHGGAVVSAIEVNEELNLIMDASLVTTPLPFIKEYLLKMGVFPGCAADCKDCLYQCNSCDCLKSEIQNLINEGSL